MILTLAFLLFVESLNLVQKSFQDSSVEETYCNLPESYTLDRRISR